jgi:hypothetical protein
LTAPAAWPAALGSPARIHAHKVFAAAETGLSRAEAAALKALRGRKVRIDPDWALSVSTRPNDFGVNSIHQIDLFSDVSVTYVVTDSDLLESGRLLVFGKVAGRPESNVILAFNHGFLNGSVLDPGAASYQIASGPGGLHTILQLDPSARIDCGVQ